MGESMSDLDHELYQIVSSGGYAIGEDACYLVDSIMAAVVKSEEFKDSARYLELCTSFPIGFDGVGFMSKKDLDKALDAAIQQEE